MKDQPTSTVGEIILLGDAAPGGPSPVAIDRVRASAPAARVLVLSEQSAGETILAALRAGAAGYLVAPAPAERVIEALEALRRGDCPLSPLATRRLVESLHRPAPPPAALSGREKEVFELLVRGLRYRDIAERLFISIETVRSHIRKIYRKLAVSSRAELTARFLLHAPVQGRG